jgi:spore maturation protein CgeB
MKTLRILYLGDDSFSSTSRHRADALVRLGCRVTIVDVTKSLGLDFGNPLISRIHYLTGYSFIQKKVRKILCQLSIDLADLVWINSGELFGSACVGYLKQLGVPVVLYCNDDPTGIRDGNRFKQVKRAIPNYDLCVVPRIINVSEFQSYGAKNCLRHFMSYDEVVHCPVSELCNVENRFRSDISFIGTCISGDNRDEFLLKLMADGLDVVIWGARWERSPHWAKLKPLFRGPSLAGRDYVAAIQGSKISLGMLSKGNRDLHTQRSAEIPYAGGLLCAERTSEHCEMYRENVDAIFWTDAKECASICKELLADDERRERIRLSGMKRVRELKIGNEDLCLRVLQELGLR